ncbi:TIM-barrel domain-containing protein [Listeria costaricensis]|uniref:TIM-barrel domain-containing protein n=1 Tax=Listeria costaricensis TaxID=2026604 RepID=UPI000C073069|nr:TIM-barrel domain-containing protein [Listeria costaricensis]
MRDKKGRKRWIKRISAVLVALLLTNLFASTAFALDGVYHNPYGDDDLYTVQPTERSPRDPKAGEDVILNITTWPIESGQSVWVEWTKNDEAQPDVGAAYNYNSGNNTYWDANIGSFKKGDKITYTIKANVNGGNEVSSGPYTFYVTDWEYVQDVTSVEDQGDKIALNMSATAGTFSPKLYLSFKESDVLRTELSPTGNETGHGGISGYTLNDTADHTTITTDKLRVEIDKQPYRMEVYKADGTKLTEEYTTANSLGWLTDGKNVINQFQNSYATPLDEAFYGFGERYDSLNQRGYDVETYVYNEYQDQAQTQRTYLAVPFFVSDNHYGMYVDSDFHSQFQMATKVEDKYTFVLDNDGDMNQMLDYYIIGGDDQNEIVDHYTDITGKTELLPKWAFGLWMSANEWNQDADVQNALANAKANDIPATGFVLEQWSDEETYYIWNDATYTPKVNGEPFSYSDFTFNGRWKDPKGMVQDVHDAGMNIVLWQVPVLKDDGTTYEQRDNDEAYMIAQGYCADDGTGAPYRVPASQWFGNGILLDFTNQEAVDWWTSQREYLVSEVGIDGFKTDGGEMVWGHDTTFANGETGQSMRNRYPSDYVSSYFNFARDLNPNAVSFSRSGTSGAQTSGIYWSGDQPSTFDSFQASMKAGLSAASSGVSYWAWDMAGFTGDYPTAELYKRATEMAAFCPIMQFHSEKSDPTPSEERSPWNAVARTGDESIMPTFQKYFYSRMNLLPYIYTSAKETADNGKSMMRPMAMDYPDDVDTKGLDEQYMFGDNLLVAPVMESGQTTKEIYLPEGEWIDLWNGGIHTGGETINYYADVDTLPVFVKAGAIVPMNLTDGYELGQNVGNDLEAYDNFTYRIYPSGDSSYSYYDDVNDGNMLDIRVAEDFANEKVTVNVPAMANDVTLQVFGTEPSDVTVGGTALTACATLADFNAASSGYYYNAEQNLTYVKVPQASTGGEVLLTGIHHAPYEAEFGHLTNVGTASDHAGYTGTGFVAGLDQTNQAVELDIQPENGAGNYTMEVRYSAGVEDATRTVYVNGAKQTINLPKTADWDTWATVEVPITLHDGNNQVVFTFGDTDTAGINFDHVVVK